MASMNRRSRDPLFGKIVLVTGGEWKGFRGRVVAADDKAYIVEITSKCRRVPIDRHLVTEDIAQNK